MKLQRTFLGALLFAATATAVLAQAVGNSNGSTAVGNGSSAAAYISPSASPGALVCVGPTSGPNNLLVSTPCNAPSGVVTGLTAGANIVITGGAPTPTVATTQAPTFTGDVTALGFFLPAAGGTSITSGTAVPSATASPGSLYLTQSSTFPFDALQGVGNTFPGAVFTTFINSSQVIDGASNQWILNDPSGTVAVNTVNAANNGTYNAAKVTLGTTALTADSSFSATATGASNQALMYTPFTDVNGTGSWSVELLWKAQTCTNGAFNCALMGNATNTGHDGFFVGSDNATNNLYAYAGLSGSATQIGTNFTTVSGAIYDIVVTYYAPSTLWTFYVNGKVQGTLTQAYVLGGQQLALATLGGTTAGGSKPSDLAGSYNSFATYTYALSPTAVQANTGSSVTTWLPLSTASSFGATFPIVVTQNETSVNYSCPTCNSATVYQNSTNLNGLPWHEEFGKFTTSTNALCAALSICSLSAGSFAFNTAFTSPPVCLWTAVQNGTYGGFITDNGSTTTMGQFVYTSGTASIPSSTTLSINYDCKGQ